MDGFLIASLSGAAVRVLHAPVPREVSVTHDAPWEGNTCGYHTVFRDGDLVRMYYRGSHAPAAGERMKTDHPQFTCYAESPDGMHWRKPELGLFEFEGSTANNIVWTGIGTHNFAPFRDSNPGCPPEEQYKALGHGQGGLFAFASPDGIHWSLLRETPVITKGAFDSQNLAFWDAERSCYADYHRGFARGVRAIMTCTSTDFRSWTEPVWLKYPDGTPAEHLYTNQILPYPRAPHIRIGFPKRFFPDRHFPGNRMAGLSDGVFMSSRDGLHFERWGEAFLRPGPQRERWVNRNNMTAWGVVQTVSAIPGCPDEISVYSTEGYYTGDDCRIRRYSLRLDGFVSVHASMAGGELVTRAVTFAVPPPASGAAAASVALDGPVVIDRGQPLRGAGSLRVREPVVVSIPRTAALGPSVTLALSARGIPPGHRRLFSAYNGGPIREGEGELVFDLVAGGAFPDGTGLRFQYDGVHVAARVSDLPGWADAFAGDAVHHLAVTWDGGVVCLFYDGTMVASGGSPGRGEVRLALGDLRFGEDYPPTGLANEPFLGTADDILVLAEALSGEDLARLAAEGSGFLVDRQARGVLYSMDDAAGTTLIDRLTADGASDATLPASAGPLPGDCQLLLNAATSAGGGIRVELQDGNGVALPGHGLADSDVLFGDGIDLAASWGQRTELRHLAGQPVRIRFELRDADLYALRFGRPESLLPRGPDRAEH